MLSPNEEAMMVFLNDQLELDHTIGMERSIIHDPVVMLRREVINWAEYGVRIDSFVKLEGGDGIDIGVGVHIASFAHLNIGGGRLTMGEFSCVASGGKIISGTNKPDAICCSASAPRIMQRIEKYHTKIGAYAIVFTNAVVFPGVTLGEGAVLTAGSVAVKDIPAWEIWSGNPAKFWKKRVVRP